MRTLIWLSLKGVFRDRVFHGILMVAVVFALIPGISTLSMRQVTELSLTLSLSLISFILLLLAVFLGGTSLWKDIERRYTFSVLGLPLARRTYLLGKFAGVALFVLLTGLALGAVATVCVWYTSTLYPPERAVVWINVGLAILFDCFKYVLLVAFAFLFSTVSTSFFLPIFGAFSIFLVGGSSQGVFDYIHSPAGQSLTPIAKQLATLLYYVLPNFSAFDLKVNAIYGIALSPKGLLLTTGYFLVYVAIVLTLSVLILEKRELK